MIEDFGSVFGCSLLVLASGLACKSSSDGGNEAAGLEPAANEAPVAAEREADPTEAATQRARALTRAFAEELQATLLAAIEADGLAHAIDVCQDQAPAITAKHAGDGWTLSRTALRVRNPKNAATPWQQAVLRDWQAEIEAGSGGDPAALEWTEVVDGQLRYMRAIPLGGVCLGCHGPADQIDAAVKQALAERYPEDQATGFRVGELRGAFVVTGPV